MHKVLIVDDESWVVESLKDLVDWKQYGFEVAGQAHNGTDALEAMTRIRPDVVFTDIRMPEMNGLELIQRARTLPFPMQFVVVSGYAEFAYAQKALTYGAAAYCLKPFDELEIAGVLLKLNRTLTASKPAAAPDASLLQLLEEPAAENDTALREAWKRHGLADWSGAGPAAVYAVAAVGKTGLPGLKEPAVSLQTGTSKTAYLLTGRQLEDMRTALNGGLPDGLSGVGVSAAIGDPREVKRAIEAADELAHQWFVTEMPGLYEPRPFKGDELNRLMAEMSEAVRSMDRQAAQRVFGRLEALFGEGALSIRHAFQVYNMTVSFLFRLGQTETMLYSYEQLAQSFRSAFAMLDELTRLADRYLGGAETPLVETKNQTFQAILQYVTQHFSRDISLQSLSERFFMNPSYISQLFRKEVGETFTAYVARLRIAYACELLVQGDDAIQTIAEKIGYHDYFYFTRLFKRTTGKTPAQYRNELG